MLFAVTVVATLASVSVMAPLAVKLTVAAKGAVTVAISLPAVKLTVPVDTLAVTFVISLPAVTVTSPFALATVTAVMLFVALAVTFPNISAKITLMSFPSTSRSSVAREFATVTLKAPPLIV